jgi:hypothetical protein
MADPNNRPGEKPDEPIHIDAEDARAGEIILRKRWQRRVFLAGLAGIVILFVVVFLALRFFIRG